MNDYAQVDPFEDDNYEEPIRPNKKNFPQQEGEIKVPGPLTIDSVTDRDGANGKAGYAIIKIKGYWDSFLADQGKYQGGQVLADGITLIGKASGNEQYPFRYSLPRPKTGGSFPGQGGGARSNWQPKTPEEFHAPSIGGIIKSCIEAGQEEAVALSWINLYLDCCRKASNK